MRSVAIAEPLFSQRADVSELKAAPEDVMRPAYGCLLVAVEHLFPGHRRRNSASFTAAHQFTVKGRGKKRERRERWRETASGGCGSHHLSPPLLICRR